MEKQCFRKRRIPIFIKHGLTAAIFISIYYFFDFGLMRLFLLIQLIVFINDLRHLVYIETETNHLFYRTLFRTRSIPIQQIGSIYLAEKTTVTGTGGASVSYYFQVLVKTEDDSIAASWELPTKVIPKKERSDFERVIKRLNPSTFVNLVTPVYTI